MAKASTVEALSFEEALSELEKIVRGLEGGASDLKTSIDAYARGVELRAHCEAKLKEAQMKIEKITVGADGKTGTAPFKAE